jgi:hypothetical protein
MGRLDLRRAESGEELDASAPVLVASEKTTPWEEVRGGMKLGDGSAMLMCSVLWDAKVQTFA